MAVGILRKKVLRKFKLRGYILNTDALEEILSFLTQFENQEDEAIDILLDEINKESLNSSVLDRDSVHRVISLLLEAESAVEASPSSSNRSHFRIVDSFIIPKFCYDPIMKTFYDEASSKADLYRDRFQLLLRRLSRDPHFAKPAFDSEFNRSDSCEVSPIQSLIGQTGRRWIMGVISQLEDGHFHLEDMTAAVPVDLSKAKITTGFFVENTVIVAEGELLPSGIFQVNTCGFPPLEARDESNSLLVGLDFFGCGAVPTEEMLRLSELEKKAVNDMFVIFSDIWLDDAETMEKLATVLNGYENEVVVPSLFVFMGNFCSRPCNLAFNAFSSPRSQFGKLGELIGAHTRLMEHIQFLFILGPEDAGPSTVLPRPALPKYLTEELQKHVPNAIFKSNPCRIKFYTQEIFFFHQVLLYKMRRSCLIPPSTEEISDPFEHVLSKVLLSHFFITIPPSLLLSFPKM